MKKLDSKRIKTVAFHVNDDGSIGDLAEVVYTTNVTDEDGGKEVREVKTEWDSEDVLSFLGKKVKVVKTDAKIVRKAEKFDAIKARRKLKKTST